MERKLSVGETMGEVFQAYREHAGLLLPLAFWLYLVVSVAGVLTAGDLSLFLPGSAVGFAITGLYQGMVARLVSDSRSGRRTGSMVELGRSVLPVLGRLLGAGIIFWVGILVGITLFLAPGLYLLTIWAVLAPVIVIERRRVFDALGRSRELVRGNGWRVLATVSIGFLASMAAALVTAAIAESIANGPPARIVLGALTSAVVAPIAALVAAVLYFRLLALKGEQAPALSVPQQPGDGLG